MIEGEERNETETTGAVGPDVHVGYAAEPTQQLNNDHLAEIWGIKSVGAKIKETQQKKEVTKLTLDMMNDSLKDVLRRKRKTELERTIARISDRIKALRECNAELESLMIQAGNPPQEVAALNYQNEVGLDVYLDMQSVVEEMLETCEPQKQEQKGSDVDTDKKPLDAKLIKLPITKYDGDPLRWLEFWEQFDIAVHSRKLENVIKFSYLREYLSGKAAAVIKGIPIKSENYKIAIERLKKEYGSDAKVRSAHIKAIRDIQSVQSISNLPKLRQFYEVVATNYASLESMGYKDHVLCLVEETIMKLPRIARYEITKEDREWTKWGFDKFLEKFWDYLRACEDIEPIQSIPAERDTGKRETPRFYSGKPKSESSTILSTTSHTRSCVYCNDTGHCSTDCTKLKGSQERKAFLQHTHRCYNCTGTKHLSKDCRSTRNCAHCNERHHTSICLKKAKTLQKEPSLHITNGPVAYQTVQAKIGGILCRALLDSGSGQSYVSREHARKLDIRPCREESRVIGTVNGDMNVQCPIYELEVQGIGEWSKTEFKTQFARLNVSVLSTVPNVHPEIAKENYIHLHDIKFSDISVKEALPIHAILGVKDYAHIKMGNIRKGKDGDPIAEETALGWTLMGHLYESKEQKTNINLAIDKETTIQEDSRRLWDLDVLGIKDDEEMYAEFKDSIKQNEDGRYCVKLPWKQGSYFLPDNRTLAEQRVRSQLKRMSKQPELLKEYDNIIRQQEEQGIIEPVPEKPDGDRIHYIPHHCVVREQAESTKVRIVYDASAKERKYARSLNDCLHIGPALQPLLYDILIRVRLHKSVLIGDIKKAFLQIEVVPEDRDALRFLWVESIKDEPPKIRELRFNRVIFGAGPSPFLLNATLQHHIKKYDTDPAFVKQVLKSLYCDDFVGVSNSTEELVELKIKLEQRLKEGKFEMHKWKSNDPSLREICATEEASMTKVLGIQWNTSTDNMSVNFSHAVENENSLTQRGLLRTTASIFDPLGIGSPVTISAKIIYHEVCLKRLGWDTQIPSDQARLWDSWVRSIKRHPKLQHNRCVIKHLDEPILDIKLHGFADASFKACAAVIYVQITQTSESYVQLLTAKSRVSKPGLTVPRLELVAAQMLVKMLKQVQLALERTTFSEIHGWSDSKTVLCWLKNKSEWKQFVRLRVDQILQESNIKWHYVNTKDNPADIASRGMHIHQLASNELWWRGPPWLNDQRDWPSLPELKSTEESEAEKRNISATAVIAEKSPQGLEAIIDLQRYDSQHKVIRITAWVYRFVNNARIKDRVVSKTLSIEETRSAEVNWIQQIQGKTKSCENFQQLQNQLNLKVEDGILKCHGRLEHAEIESKPILLPRDHLFTTLVIKDAHRKVLHLGVSTTLAEVRQKYWVPKGRQVVKKILKNCQRCKILSAKPLPSAATSALPECRVKSGHAFETIGVDFAGPFYCSNGRKTIKAYITLFTCATSRAVHIEAATDMSVNTFKQSLRSFITRRGMPSRIISDNAQTFKSAAKWLKKLKNSEEVNNFLESKGINWQFNVARAPWWGGFFERLIGLVKSCLMKILGRAKISFKEFKECLLDVEATLNNRPLTYLDEEFGPEALTPNHLIHGRRIPTLAWEEPESDNEIDATRRWKHLQKQLQHFWKRWNREYVSSLREHHRLNSRTTKNSLKPGAIVLIQQEGVSKSRWKLGRVDRLIEGKDGIIRGAVLKVVSNDRIYTVERPIQRLCLLELYAEESNVKGTIPDQTEALRRSTRDAAAVANVKIKNIRDISENQDFV